MPSRFCLLISCIFSNSLCNRRREFSIIKHIFSYGWTTHNNTGKKWAPRTFMEFLCSGALTVTKTHRERKRNREIDKNTRNVHAYELESTKEWKLAYKLQVICTWQKLSRTKSNNPPTMLLRYIHRILFYFYLFHRNTEINSQRMLLWFKTVFFLFHWTTFFFSLFK